MSAKIDPAAVGARIRARREQLGLTQHDLAARIETHKRVNGGKGGVSSSRVSGWESGSALPSRLLAELCEALDIGADELLHGLPLSDRPELSPVKLTELRKLLSDTDLARLRSDKLPHLARLLEGENVEAWRAKAALEMLFPAKTTSK